MGRGGFGKGKYKKIIKSIYPLTPDGDIQVHNIGKLVHFCQISPSKLIKVAAYVEKKTNSDLTKSKLRFVGASMKIFQDLIKGCRKNLNLFSNNILRLIKLLLGCSFPKLKIIASETFIQFTEVLDETTPYPELEGLISYLIEMCQNQIRDSAVRTRLKQDGLRSIRAYIRVLEMTDELDGFIARHSDEDNWAVLLPAILDNLSFSAVSTPRSEASEPNAPVGVGVGVSVGVSVGVGAGMGVQAPTATPTQHSVAAPLANTTVTTHSSHASTEDEDEQIAIHQPAGADATPGNLYVQSPNDVVDRESVHALATEVLRDIFSRANISVTSMFKAILRYLEFRHRWMPNAFAVYILQSVYDCLKVQHGQILITLLLQHAELPQHSITVKSQIFRTTVQFFTESTGYFMQILDSLVKHMVSSVEFTSQDQQVVDNINTYFAFQDDMIACLGVLCNKISQQQKLDAFSALCNRLSMSKHVSTSGLSGVVVIFARAILQVTLCTQNLPVELLIPYLRLFQDLSTHNNNDVRIFVQKIFQSILLPGFGSQQPIGHANFPKFGEPIPDQVAVVVRGTLYSQIKMRTKLAENFVVIYDTLRAMLYKGGKYDLVESFPLVFSIQKFATKWKKIPPVRAYTIHTLVAAYLYCVAFIFRCPALDEHVTMVLQNREKRGQVCSLVILQKGPIPSLLLSSATVEYSFAPQKKVAVEYILFDRQTVVDILCSEGGSSISNEKRLSKLLMKKFKNQSDTITINSSPLTTMESTYFPPLSPTTGTTSNSGFDIQNASTSITSNLTSTTKPMVVFSTVANSDELDKVQKNSKIDIISMKRALVVGVPSQKLHKLTVSYSDITNNCFQKVIHDRQLLVLKTESNVNTATLCVFDLDLSTALNKSF